MRECACSPRRIASSRVAGGVGQGLTYVSEIMNLSKTDCSAAYCRQHKSSISVRRYDIIGTEIKL